MNMKCGILTGITLKILSTFIYGSEFGRKRKKMNNWNNPVKTECTGSISPASKTRVPSIFVIYETLPIHKI